MVAATDPARTDPPESDTTELPSRTRTVIARLSRRLRQTRAGADLSTSQYQVLATTVRHAPVRLTRLADLEGLNPTMLSRIVAKLEAAGLVARTPDPDDGRAAVLTATRQGRDLVARVRRERTDALSLVIDGLDDGQRSALLAALPVLESMAEALKDRPR
jgi:DNA-binding MarR family transcriptional regulator